ncbi:hypothetical protein AB1Y20_004135 [Prymnesium parvum]|uniref:Apple domain-containing protein n=1 Tax=Prymnesium parvum TaxID=97485 RepID=A0AB34J9D2_PRYPA
MAGGQAGGAAAHAGVATRLSCEAMTRSMLDDPRTVPFFVYALAPPAWWKPAHADASAAPWYLPSSEEARLEALAAALAECPACCAEATCAELPLRLVERLAEGCSRREELLALRCLDALASSCGAGGALLALVPYMAERLEPIAALNLPATAELELLLLAMVGRMCGSDAARHAIVATNLPLILACYCAAGSALAGHALEALRGLAGHEALRAEWSLVQSLLSIATGGAVEERLSAVRALQTVNEQGGLHDLGEGCERLIHALEEALRAGRLPRRRRAGGAAGRGAACEADLETHDEVRWITELLGALDVCRREESSVEYRQLSMRVAAGALFSSAASRLATHMIMRWIISAALVSGVQGVYWVEYEGYDSFPGSDFLIYTHGNAETHDRFVDVPTCEDDCIQDPECHGFVTFEANCYFRGSSDTDDPAKLVEHRIAHPGSTLHVVFGRHHEPPAPPPSPPPPSPPLYPFILDVPVAEEPLFIVGAAILFVALFVVMVVICRMLCLGMTRPREPPPSHQFVRAHRVLSFKKYGRSADPAAALV